MDITAEELKQLSENYFSKITDEEFIKDLKKANVEFYNTIKEEVFMDKGKATEWIKYVADNFGRKADPAMGEYDSERTAFYAGYEANKQMDRAKENELLMIAARWEAICNLLDGEEVSDFMLSFPEVLRVSDLINLSLKNGLIYAQKQDGQRTKEEANDWKIRSCNALRKHTVQRAIYRATEKTDA